MIDIIYKAEEKELNDRMNRANKRIEYKIKNIDIDKITETNNKEEIRKILDNIEENYSIKIGEYSKEFYKQGFIDGINLILNCLK